MCPTLASHLTSGSQTARVVTEAWGEDNLYCAACDGDKIYRAPCNTRAIDFTCQSCGSSYQLKSGRSWNERRIPDAGYHAMMEAIEQDHTPNLLILQYTSEW